ncbi:MAG: HDIG domain-containing metalloprotein, partial [Candidatus Latescibacterota bacterium]
KAHLNADHLIKHSLASEAIMRALARRLGHDEDLWGIAGLLHDLDFEETKENPAIHGLKTAQILKENGLSDDLIEAVKRHNAEGLGLVRGSDFDHALAAAETVTGLIVATALVYPDKKLASVRVGSLTKRMKKKDFARAVDRSVIVECEELGLGVDEFLGIGLEAMQGIHEELGL